jgi:hypothetical protein
MENIIVRPAHEYQEDFDNDEIGQFLQIVQKKNLEEEIREVNINLIDSSVWIDYDKKISLKTNFYINLETLVRTIFNIHQDVQIFITKIFIGGDNIEFHQNFILKSLEEIREEYENLIIEFTIL